MKKQKVESIEDEQKQEVYLTEKQLKGLEALASINVEDLKKSTHKRELSWLGKAFDWFDYNVLDKSSRLIMVSLELAGVIAIYIVLGQIDRGLSLMKNASIPFEMQKAQAFLGAIKDIAPSLSAMIVAISGVLPTLIGAFRALKSKWKNGNGKETTSTIN